MSKILFAMTHVLTSQGWFQPATLLPQLDLPEEEIDKLVEEKNAALCDHDSPLAQRVHELAKIHTDKLQAIHHLKHAVETLSAVSPGEESIELDDPTPDGEFPSLETWVAHGYEPDSYERAKVQFYESKDQGSKPTDENPGSHQEPATESTTA